MKNQFNFKPFDRVLVRDQFYQNWEADLYSYLDQEGRHHCVSSHWVQCIPYNENTAHLIGTNKPYEEPEPKVWRVININTDTTHEFTQSQFEHFIKDVIGSNIKCCYQIGRINNN